MSRGFCYLAERSGFGFPLAELESSLTKIRIWLNNPSNGRITELSDEGDQIEVTRAELNESLRCKSVATFQLWLAGDTDIRCSYRHIEENLFVHAYGFDGLDKSEADRVAQWALDRFTDQVAEGNAVLLAVDRSGETNDFDWDALVGKSINLPPVLPEAFGFDTRTIPVSPNVMDGYMRQSRDGYILFIKKQRDERDGVRLMASLRS